MPTRVPSLRQPPVGFAHRGARAHAPENTLESFRLALKLGAAGLESDVWLSADGKAVLDHDGLAGGRLRRRRIAEVPRDDLPAHMPTLAELFEACGLGFELSLDIKDPAAIAEVIATVRDAGPEAESRLWVCHDDAAQLASWRELSPLVHLVHSTRLKRLDGSPERHAARLAEVGIGALNLHHSEWTGGLVALVHRFDIYALAWDAQFERVLDETLQNGVDGVFSDHVDRMVDAISRLG